MSTFAAFDQEDELQRKQRVFRLSATQRAFVESTDKYTFYVGGVGAGKTYAGAVRSIMHALSPEWAGSIGVIAAPTYAMLEDATVKILRDLLPSAAIRKWDLTRHNVDLINGSRIMLRSLDKPDALRGSSIAWFWMDEAPICGYYAWEVLKARLRQDQFLERVCAWATGTPKGQDEYWRDFENPATKLEDHRLFRASTFENAVNLPSSYVHDLGYEGAFYEQEVLGLFTAYKGLVYRFNSIPGATSNLRTPRKDQKFKQIVGGIDWGYNHPSAILPFGIDEEQRAYQLAEYVERGKTLHDDIIPQVIAFTRKYKVETWYCDPAAPQNIVELNRALDRAMLNCYARAADNDVITGIQTMHRQLALRPDGTRGLYVNPTCVRTITEYGQYQYEETREGTLPHISRMERPSKHNDDAMDATRYAIHSTLGIRNTTIGLAGSHGTHELRGSIELALSHTSAEVEAILREELAALGEEFDFVQPATEVSVEHLAERIRAAGRSVSFAEHAARGEWSL